jgi:hypothetical protein
MVDLIVPRPELRATLATLLGHYARARSQSVLDVAVAEAPAEAPAFAPVEIDALVPSGYRGEP